MSRPFSAFDSVEYAQGFPLEATPANGSFTREWYLWASTFRPGTAMRIALALAFSTCLAWPAQAMMATEARSPTSSSIPCAGALKEVLDGGAIGSNVSNALTLTCTVGDAVSWTLRASVSCGSGEDGMPSSFCAQPKARPVFYFDSASAGPKQVYRLFRYVFARQCAKFPVRKRHMLPVSNKVTSEDPQAGLACKEVNVVDGTRANEDDPSKWTYATVVTSGSTFGSSDGIGLDPVLGVDVGDYEYGLSWTKP